MDGKVGVCDGRTEVGGISVAICGGENGEGEDIINIDERMEGWGVEGVDEVVHDGIGDGRDEVPSKWWAEQADVEGGANRRDDREYEGVGVRWGKKKGPVEVCNVSTVEEDRSARAEKEFECVEVWKRVVFGEEGVLGIGKLSIEDGSELGGVLLGSDEEFASRRVGGDLCTVCVDEIHGHVPERGDVVGGRGRGRRWRGEARSGSVDV